MCGGCCIAAILVLAVSLRAEAEATANNKPAFGFHLQAGDVVAFIGGESMVVQNETGHLESLLAAAFAARGIRFRDLAWEGDTVFEQPRDLNFPGLAEQLKRIGATVIVADFGRAEVLAGPQKPDTFIAAYEKLCEQLAKQTTRIVLVTPAPFEKPRNPALPDLSSRNDDVRAYAAAIRQLAQRRGYTCADVCGAIDRVSSGHSLTADGLHLTPQGAAAYALAVAREMKIDGELSSLAADASGKWNSPKLESLRQAIIAKNRLWFDYSRPMNWAFLGGDRTFTQSSRDPNDLTVRIFQRELDKFLPLIEQAEGKIEQLAKAAVASEKR